jgi:prepilin signal peptidase PulO-like enzyme (type II secretory pathway)
MRYHPPPPSEPNGCIQTLVISRMIFMILLIPMLLIMGVLFAVMAIFVAYSRNPVLGLLVVTIIGALFYLVVKWEQRRVEREQPPDY